MELQAVRTADGDRTGGVTAEPQPGYVNPHWPPSPPHRLLPFIFPRRMTLGGWLAGGIAWHISAMWVLFRDGLAYITYGVLSGHFRHDIPPVRPKEVFRDLGAAIRFRLDHHLGHHNAIQRLLYAGIVVVICLAIATGLSIWKPVQLGWPTDLFGGYPVARGIHLAMMGLIVAFPIVRLALVGLFPRTLLSMLAPIAANAETLPR